MKKRSIKTTAVHAGESRGELTGAVTTPIFQSSTYLYEGETSYEDLRYIRLNNTPNHEAASRKIAALEGAESALVTSSGMSAISDSLLSFLENGDHLLAQNCIYGGTRDLIVHDFPRYGISVDFLEDLSTESLEKGIRPDTKAILAESITNPLMQVEDLVSAADFARKKGLVSLIDNTFASPCNFRPISIGFDLVLHSATKYLNGHSDVVAGAVAGKSEHINRINNRNIHYGGTLDPHACFLLQRGMKTLPLRMKQHNENASVLAEFLSGHPGIEKVHFPGLPSSGGSAETKSLFAGFGGMLSIELKNPGVTTRRFLEKLELPLEAPSLGGVESLITRPSTTSHSGLSAAERREAGISDYLVRISTGIEASEDLVEDFRQALE